MKSEAVSDLLESLVAIPSITGAEEDLVRAVETRFRSGGWTCVSMPVSPGRRNLLVRRGNPIVVFSTHADTVAPFFAPRREDAGAALSGRGACDAKASLAAMVLALKELDELDILGEGSGAALLLVVGEERGSDGALAANVHPLARESRYLVGGEPTGNRFVAGSKGCLRVALETRGLAGHSSITAAQGARSAVDPLLDALGEIRRLSFPNDPVFGETTANIGVIEAGTAPNVVAERGRAEILFRTGISVAGVYGAVERAVADRAQLSVPYRSEPIVFRVPRGLDRAGEIVSFACDLPLLDRWGEPILIGPGSISFAHAAAERVDLSQVREAVPLYRDLAQGLLARGEAYLEHRHGG